MLWHQMPTTPTVQSSGWIEQGGMIKGGKIVTSGQSLLIPFLKSDH